MVNRYKLHSLDRCCGSEGCRKRRSLRYVQSTIRTHLAGIQEAPLRLSCPRNRLLSVFASKYAIRLYAWAKDHLSVGTKRITLEELRTVLGLDPVKDTDGNVIREARLGAWANFRQRALNIAMAEINAKTDLNIALESLEQAEHQRVAALIFTIKGRTVSKGKPSG
jgi:Initiator Replication protein